MFVHACAHACVLQAMQCLQGLTLVLTSPAHRRCLAVARISGIGTSQHASSSALNKTSTYCKLQILTKVKCLFKHQNICNCTVYLTRESFNNATFY